MAIEMNNLFNKPGNLTTAAQATEERKKADFWLNIGYQVETEKDGETVQRFISLPTGIPLDTQEHLPIRGNNQDFKNMRSAQNELLDMLKEAAAAMQPGEAQIVNLQIELRRVNGEQAATPSESNPFSLKSKLVG